LFRALNSFLGRFGKLSDHLFPVAELVEATFFMLSKLMVVCLQLAVAESILNYSLFSQNETIQDIQYSSFFCDHCFRMLILWKQGS